jgi:hypothetical protein
VTTRSLHAEWLSLIEVSGPFLTLPVLTRAFPAGLEPTDLELVEQLRVAYSEVSDEPTLAALWVQWVLERLLGHPDEVLRHGASIDARLTYRVAEYGVELRPDYAVVDPERSEEPSRTRLLVVQCPWGAPLDERPGGAIWAASPIDRLEELCRATGVRLGLLTNGQMWTLVDAPVGGVSGTASWDSELWLEERSTLDAFTTLLGARRFFTVPESETLEALLGESANAEAEVTDQLGRQVRAAVELLVDAWSKINRERRGRLFADLQYAEVYEGAVTVLMRLVFLLCAEERGLFLLGDPVYDASYAVSTLRAQLEEEANTYGEDVLERRSGAWHRLLATFRMVYAGAHHENLSLPAYGGSLFDPDRFPWIEGRNPDGSWHSTLGAPLPVDDRTILHILDALQVLRFSGRGSTIEARRLSFRALDVEQIGHVYEGLLDRAAIHVDDVLLGLMGSKQPELALEEVETHANRSREDLEEWLSEKTGLSSKAVAKALGPTPSAEDINRLTSACDNDHALADRVAPYVGVLRRDLRGLPQVWLPGSIVMTQSGDRRSSGTYYTPRTLAEEMVRYALEPLVYRPGAAEGILPDQWQLRPAAELLDLRVCDLAMGSGAFLVAACRYLAARLLEAWSLEGLSSGDPVGPPGGVSVALPGEEVDREVLALRLVADRCLYGVDRNPMATEMAKLSLWLVTLAKNRPFSFIDHALRVGDSLLGITSLAQLEYLHLDPAKGAALHGGTLFDPTTVLAPVVNDALRERRELESFLVLDVTDAETKRRLFDEARGDLESLIIIANIVVGATLSTARESDDALERRLLAIAPDVRSALEASPRPEDQAARIEDLRLRSDYWLDEGKPQTAPDRKCLHWPLEFPEIFLDRDAPGFDALVGNPPFLGGKRISTAYGSAYESFLKVTLNHAKGAADISAHFLRRAGELTRANGNIGLITTDRIAQGDTQLLGLGELFKQGFSIYRADSRRPWPGASATSIATIHARRSRWQGDQWLDGRQVREISSSLSASSDRAPRKLLESNVVASTGTSVYGEGFVLSLSEAESLLNPGSHEWTALRPYLSAADLTSEPTQKATRLVIDIGNVDSEPLLDVSYPALAAHLRKTVKPMRESLSGQIHQEAYWRFWDLRPALYNALSGTAQAIACARLSKYLVFELVSSDQIFSDNVVVFASDDLVTLGVLSSGIHGEWVEAFKTNRGDGVRYVVSRCLRTFPWPALNTEAVATATGLLHLTRSATMASRWEGLTRIYNRVHEPKEEAADIAELRRMHVALDHAVAAAYGWEDLELDHDFCETRQGTRFTIGPDARVELLDRLLELNHARYDEEVKMGLHAKRPGASKDRGRRLAAIADTMFELEAES